MTTLNMDSCNQASSEKTKKIGNLTENDEGNHYDQMKVSKSPNVISQVVFHNSF